jgi:AcrR family transcriptional regulator
MPPAPKRPQRPTADFPSTPKGLPRGPHSLSREEVAANQQLRLGLAMLAAVGEKGYIATTVSEVVARAGVSRKAFYQHFAGKEECFLAAYDVIVRESRCRVARAYGEADGRRDRLESAIRALFGAAVETPHALRLALIDIAALGPAGIERRERGIAEYGQLIHDGLKTAGDGKRLPETTLHAIVGGFNRVLAMSLRAGRRAKTLELVPDLVRWADSYHPPPQALLDGSRQAHDGKKGRMPAGRVLGGRAPGTLFPQAQLDGRVDGRLDGRRAAPRRSGPVSRSFVVQAQRARILDAVTNLTAANGYASLTVEDIAREGAVSLQAFYEHFTGKEDAFLVAYEFGHTRALSLVEGAFGAAPSWRDGVRDALATLIDYLASEPAYARLALLGTLIATPRATELFDEGIAAYAQMLRPGLDEIPKRNRPPPVAVDAIAGGLQEMFFHYAVQDRIHELPELTVDATYVALAPFVGSAEAARIAVEPASV